jgi:hypothetical protein
MTAAWVYNKLVRESGWTADQFQRWLQRTLLETLTDCDPQELARLLA